MITCSHRYFCLCHDIQLDDWNALANRCVLSTGRVQFLCAFYAVRIMETDPKERKEEGIHSGASV